MHSRYTHRSSALSECPLGCLPSLSLTTKGSWIHLLGEGVAKPVISSLTPVHPTALLLFSLGSSLPKCLYQCTVNEQETQLKWFPLELGTGAGIKNTRIMGLEG